MGTHGPIVTVVPTSFHSALMWLKEETIHFVWKSFVMYHMNYFHYINDTPFGAPQVLLQLFFS